MMRNPVRSSVRPRWFHRPRRGRAFGAITLLTLASLPGCGEAEPAASAEVAPAEHRIDVAALEVGVSDLESSLQISGNLVPQTRVEIRAKLPGTLSKVNVDIGDRVRAGQVVAIMDRREIDAQVDAATATVNVAHAGVEAAEAALANATLEQERARNLFERGALPKQRLDAADTGRRSAAAQRDLALANLAQAQAALRRAGEVQRDATLTSPVEGVIVERHYDAGSFVGPGDEPVVVIADVRVMKLEAGVSELEAGRLRVGMPVRVTAQAFPGQVFDGRLAAIAPEIDARNRHFRIEVRMANPGSTLLSGMYGSAAIPLERAAKVLTVPRDAVTTRDGTRVALRIEDNVIQAVPVTEGLTDGIVTEIATGLSAGDTIVSDARQDVASGAKVNPVFAR
jgi:RND family efflux transporter MFP subunit